MNDRPAPTGPTPPGSFRVTDPPIDMQRHTIADQLAARALERCQRLPGHVQRKGWGSEIVACQMCTLVVLHGREAVTDGRALPTGIDPVCRTIHELMRDGAARTLASIVGVVRAAGRPTYSETAVSARIRDLRKLGYDYQRKLMVPAGGDHRVVHYQYVPPPDLPGSTPVVG